MSASLYLGYTCRYMEFHVNEFLPLPYSCAYILTICICFLNKGIQELNLCTQIIVFLRDFPGVISDTGLHSFSEMLQRKRLVQYKTDKCFSYLKFTLSLMNTQDRKKLF